MLSSLFNLAAWVAEVAAGTVDLLLCVKFWKLRILEFPNGGDQAPALSSPEVATPYSGASFTLRFSSARTCNSLQGRFSMAMLWCSSPAYRQVVLSPTVARVAAAVCFTVEKDLIVFQL